MAKIETVNIENSVFKHLNLSYTIGTGQKNEKNDVMLLQALFKLVGWSEFYAKQYLGLSIRELPETTGNFCAKTSKAIWSCQRKMAKKLLNLDGKVHPADYKSRNIKVKKNHNYKLMMITFLNMYAEDGAVVTNKNSVVEAVKELAPDLVFASVS